MGLVLLTTLIHCASGMDIYYSACNTTDGIGLGTTGAAIGLGLSEFPAERPDAAGSTTWLENLQSSRCRTTSATCTHEYGTNEYCNLLRFFSGRLFCA